MKRHKGWVRIFSENSPECHRTASGALCGDLGKAVLGAHTGPTEEGTMDTNVQKLGDSHQRDRELKYLKRESREVGHGCNGSAHACWVKGKQSRAAGIAGGHSGIHFRKTAPCWWRMAVAEKGNRRAGRREGHGSG